MARRKRRRYRPTVAKASKAKQHSRRGRGRFWEKLLVITFTLVTSLFLPLYFQYQSDLSQHQLVNQLGTVEAQQHDLLTRVVPSTQAASVKQSLSPCIQVSPGTIDFGSNSGEATSVPITLSNCGGDSWNTVPNPGSPIIVGSGFTPGEKVTITIDIKKI